MSIILNLDTSGDILTVCVSENGKIIGNFISKENRSHAEELTPAIEDVLIQAGLTHKSLHAIALVSGPGSYTGLRVGSAFAKASCLSLGCKLIAVTATKIQALIQLQNITEVNKDWIIVPVIDARRMEVWHQVFDYELNVLTEIETVIPENGFLLNIHQNKTIMITGNGAEKLKSVLNDKNYLFNTINYVNAKSLSLASIKSYNSGNYENIFHFIPKYSKDFYSISK